MGLQFQWRQWWQGADFVGWCKIRVLRFVKNEPFVFYYKTSYTEDKRLARQHEKQKEEDALCWKCFEKTEVIGKYKKRSYGVKKNINT